MTEIKPTDEQRDAALRFLLRECVDDIVEPEGIAQVLAEREHALRAQVAELTALLWVARVTIDNVVVGVSDNLKAIDAVLADATTKVQPTPVVAAGPWVVVDRRIPLAPVYVMSGHRWTDSIACATRFVTRDAAAATANVRGGERVETLAEAKAKVQP